MLILARACFGLITLVVGSLGCAQAGVGDTGESGMGLSASVVNSQDGSGQQQATFTWRDNIVDLTVGTDGQVIGVGPVGLIANLTDTDSRMVPRGLAGENDYLAVAIDGNGGYWLADRDGRVARMDGNGNVGEARDTGAGGA